MNDEFLAHVRSGRCRYIRGDGKTLTERGVQIQLKPSSGKGRHARTATASHERGHSEDPADEGKKHRGDTQPEQQEGIEELEADVVVLATGFERPSIDFLPEDLFPEEYSVGPLFY